MLQTEEEPPSSPSDLPPPPTTYHSVQAGDGPGWLTQVCGLAKSRRVSIVLNDLKESTEVKHGRTKWSKTVLKQLFPPGVPRLRPPGQLDLPLLRQVRDLCALRQVRLRAGGQGQEAGL